MTHEDLTEEQKKTAKSDGKCPECGRDMKLYQTGEQSPNKPEIHCHNCKLSVPLW